MNRIKSNLLYLTVIILFIGCKGVNKPIKADSVKKPDNITTTTDTLNRKDDSIKLTALVRALYKWHEASPHNNAFEPVKKKPSDTLYSGIDLDKNNASLNDLKKNGMFTNGFLADYRAIAVRLDKELKDGSSLWVVGMLPEFHPDGNEWCNCQDNPDNYWEKLTLKDIKFNKDDASFEWTWGGDFSYKTKAKKENGIWKISYLEGFDMNWYSWESEKKNKSNHTSTTP